MVDQVFDDVETYDLTVKRSDGGHDRIVLLVDEGRWVHYRSSGPGHKEQKLNEQTGHEPDFLRLVGWYFSNRLDVNSKRMGGDDGQAAE